MCILNSSLDFCSSGWFIPFHSSYLDDISALETFSELKFDIDIFIWSKFETNMVLKHAHVFRQMFQYSVMYLSGQFMTKNVAFLMSGFFLKLLMSGDVFILCDCLESLKWELMLMKMCWLCQVRVISLYSWCQECLWDGVWIPGVNQCGWVMFCLHSHLGWWVRLFWLVHVAKIQVWHL